MSAQNTDAGKRKESIGVTAVLFGLLVLVAVGLLLTVHGVTDTAKAGAEEEAPKSLLSLRKLDSADHRGPALGIAKAGPSTVQPGDLLTYTLAYTVNVSGIATLVTITDRVPTGTTYVRCAPLLLCSGGGGTVTWTLGLSAPARGVVTLTLQVDPDLPSGTRIENTAYIRAQDSEGAQDSATTMVLAGESRAYMALILRGFPLRPVVNGGFETGDATGWQLSGDAVLPIPSVVAIEPYEGNFHLLLGDPNYCNTADPDQPGDHASIASQAVRVPNVPGKPILSFWYRIFTYDHLIWTDGRPGDSLEVYVGGELALRDNFENLPQPAPGCDDVQDSGWRAPDHLWGGGVYTDVLDLSEWKGQSVQVRFELKTRWDGYYNTWAYLDAVGISVMD